jgi:NAD(P)H-dependent flavin oxidoreductase YrpB (nitropropane dioxygenase family)
VSFTFNIPDRSLIARLRAAGSVVFQTVTSLDEARRAAEASVDGLVVQGSGAGGHSGTLTPLDPPRPIALDQLVRQVRDEVRLPLLCAGGLATSEGIAAVLHQGADAVLVGTVLLRSDESGASATYQQALADRQDAPTVVTWAFSGRPARAIPNRFSNSFEALAPYGYPAVHHLTTPLRRAAAEAGHPELINIWAGTNHRFCEPGPAAAILDALAAGL